MKAIIAELNEQFPELNLSLEQLSQNQPNFMKTIENMVKAEAAAKRNQAAYDTMTDSLQKMSVAEDELVAANEDLELATQRADAAGDAFNTMYGSAEGLGAVLALLTPEWKEWNKALDEQNAAQERVDGLTASLQDAEAAYNGAHTELENWYNGLNEANEAEGSLNATLESTQEKLTEITASYTAAYDAALESIQGQYDLWDEASEISAVSVEKINHALDTQAQRWSEYQTNLDTLNAKTGEVEGLSEVIASFADGSEESMAAIAGMAQASPEELKKMVESFKTVQDAQKATADSLADLTTEYSSKMSELQSQLESDVAAMDLSAEAAANGKATVDAFANAAEASYTRVYNAYAALRQAATAALSGGGVTVTPAGYAEGTESATRGLHLVGEEGPELVYFEGGEKVLTASETKTLLNDAGQSAATPIAGGNDIKLELHINVDGNGDADGKISAAGEELMLRLEEMLDDYMADRSRRVYR